MIVEFKLPLDREKEQRSRIAQAKKQGKVFLIRRSDLVKPTYDDMQSREQWLAYLQSEYAAHPDSFVEWTEDMPLPATFLVQEQPANADVVIRL